MKNKALIYGVVVILVGIIIYFIVRQVTSPSRPDEQEKVTCQNKTVYRYKNASNAFPIVANDYNAEIRFTSDVLQKIVDSASEVGIGVNVKNQVKELQEKLNQDNITFSTGLRSYFFLLNSDPCNDSLRLRYASFTEEMSRRMLELRTITAQVTSVTEKGTSTTDTPVDTASTAVPKYKLLKDTGNLIKSIIKLDEAVQKNKNINIKLAATRLMQHP
ncbi:hypothetical protein [Ferruginibacter sp.]